MLVNDATMRLNFTFCVLLFASWAQALGVATKRADALRPNFVFILTDDQDGHMGTVDHMANLQKHIIQQGSVHPNHYCTIALCCPSRASLWTGMQGHNHNVTDVGAPYGQRSPCYSH